MKRSDKRKCQRMLLALGMALVVSTPFGPVTGFASQQTASQEENAESEGREYTFSEDTAQDAADYEAAETLSQTEALLETEEETEESGDYPAPDFTLTDQYGQLHTLSDYKGKIVFLNFWATWCPPCRAEMPDIQALYEETQEDPDSDLVILGVAFPGHSGEEDVQGVADFLEENGYTYPTVMDTQAELIMPYYIMAFPTTYMIDTDGNIYGYLSGSMDRETMDSIVQQTRERRSAD